jgi:hypothetical protein
MFLCVSYNQVLRVYVCICGEIAFLVGGVCVYVYVYAAVHCEPSEQYTPAGDVLATLAALGPLA